jgi:hypothetical protein
LGATIISSTSENITQERVHFVYVLRIKRAENPIGSTLGSIIADPEYPKGSTIPSRVEEGPIRHPNEQTIQPIRIANGQVLTTSNRSWTPKHSNILP